MLEKPSKIYYCVFWYPTIFHKEKEHKTIKPHSIDISDNSSKKEYYLTIEEELDPHKKDAIHLHYYLSKYKKDLSELKTDKSCISFVFNYIRHTRNGFVLYSYNRDALMRSYWEQFGDNQVKDIKKNIASVLKDQGNQNPTNYDIENYPIDRLLLSCYHHSKNFYHEHEVQEKADGKLEAYYFTFNKTNNKRQYLTNRPEFFPKNHEAINYFIDQFEKQFVKYAKEVSNTYRFCKRQLNRYDKINHDSKKIIDVKDKNKIDLLLTLLRWECYYIDLLEQSGFEKLIDSKVYEDFKINCMTELQLANIDEEKKEIEYLHEKIPNIRIKFLRNRLNILETICGNATTEYTYCKTLLESKYNENYNYTLPISDDEIKALIDYYEKNIQCDNNFLLKDNCRKKAFNIRNCIRYIEGIRQKCNIWENELSQALIDKVKTISEEISKISKSNQKILNASQKSSRLGELLAWISLMLGLWGLGFALKDTQINYGSSEYNLFIPIIVLGVICFIIGIVRLIIDIRKNK